MYGAGDVIQLEEYLPCKAHDTGFGPQHPKSLLWWLTPEILVLRRLKQDWRHRFETRLNLEPSKALPQKA